MFENLDYWTIYWYGVGAFYAILTIITGIFSGKHANDDKDVNLSPREKRENQDCIQFLITLTVFSPWVWPILLFIAIFYGIPYMLSQKQNYNAFKRFFKTNNE